MTTIIASQVESELGFTCSKNACDVTENVNTNNATIPQITEEKCEEMETCDVVNVVNNIDDKNGTNLHEDTDMENGKVPLSEEHDDTGMKVDLKNVIDQNRPLNEGNLENCDSIKDDNTKNPEKKKLLILDSDSEEESIFVSTVKRKSHVINDDDSDSKESDYSQNKTVAVLERSLNKRRLIDSDSEDDAVNNTLHVTEDTSKKNSLNISEKLRKLIDSESEEDENNAESPAPKDSMIIESVKKDSKVKNEKKRKGSLRASKDEAMKQIHSETQRLLREREVSLPYHRPKQRTLQEFLNRKKVAPTLPQAPTTAAKLKMSSEIVSKALEEKEKEAEEFYKSSDSENETLENASDSQKNIVPNKCIVNTNSCHSNIEKIGIEETQKVTKNNVQNAHNKKEILQQGSLDLGIPRQLFGKSFDIPLNNDLETLPENVDDDECEDNELAQKRPSKEHKLGLKHVSIPRKLFNKSPVMDVEHMTPQGERPHVINEKVSEVLNVDKDNHGQQSQEMVNKLNESSDTLFMNNTQDTNALTISETPHIDSTEILKKKQDLNNIFVQKEGQDILMDIEETRDKSSNANAIGTLDIEEKSQATDNHESTNDSEKLEGHVLGLPLPDIEDDKPSANVDLKKKIMSNMSNLKPKLKGCPGMVIDLSGNLKPNRQGINTLIDRFCKHTATTKPTENTTDVTVIHIEETANGLVPVKESLPYRVPSVANEDPELSKPGAKLLRLKEDLKLRMAMKRNEEWKEKEKQQKAEEEEDLDDDDEEEDDCPKAKKKAELIEQSGSGESEPEEDDMPIKERKMVHCDFGDEEAEVSGDEEDENEDEAENDNDELEDNNVDEDDEEEEGVDADIEDEYEKEDSEDENALDGNSSEKKKRKFRRIITTFDEETNGTSTKDSEDEENSTRRTIFERSKTDVDMFESCNGNDAWSADNDTTAFQSNVVDSETAGQPCKSPPIKSRDLLSFVSPITQLTALKCSDSAKKTPSNIKSSLLVDECTSISADNTPTGKSENACNFEKTVNSQNKLFDNPETTPNAEELMQLCSGKFSSTQVSHTPMIPRIGSTMDTNISESQLVELCSGTFSTQTNNTKNSEKTDAQIQDENSQDIKLFLDENSVSPPKKIDEKPKPENSKAPWSKFRIVSSDDEEVVERTEQVSNKIKKLNKKKVRKLELSDDEEEGDDKDSEDEEDAGLSDEENADMEDEEKYMDYDSEENEIIVTKKALKKVAAGFVEDEAELSESEWGSADEDEKDLDKLELEEGDNEDIDENQMRNQLEKIHMRQLLDDDQREVRLLKEMLFEDGDLHTEGSGRERKFKWKNIDKMGEDNDNPRPLDDIDNLVDPIEDENDIEQIKLRHEREKFLQERKKESDDDLENELGDSEIFKFGMKALKKTNKSKSKKEEDTGSTAQSEDRLFPQTVSDILNSKNSGKKTQALYKHSLLARGEETLARIAKIVKETDVTSVAKKPGKFCVFTTVSPVKDNTKENEEKEQVEKESSNKKALKRKALKGATPRSAKRSKLDENEAIRKTLFD